MMSYFIGKKVSLVALDLEHTDQVLTWINNEAINSSSGIRFPNSKTEQELWVKATIQNRSKKKLIITSTDEKEVGMVSVHNIDHKNQNCEVGIYIDPNSQGKGYASEALKLVIRFAFLELNMFKVYANIHEDNTASISLFQKLGFNKEATIKKVIFKNGQFIDNLYFSLFKESYLT